MLGSNILRIKDKKNEIARNDTSWKTYLTDLTGIWTYNYMLNKKMEDRKNGMGPKGRGGKGQRGGNSGKDMTTMLSL